MIPKKIHYIWLGKKPKTKLTEICINSWRRVLDDYEIIEWNESNLPLEELKQNKFLNRCIQLELWAFVSDYIRLYILNREGGIYLDTDVEVLKRFDNFLDQKSFIGYENNDYIGTGIIGAEQESSFIKRLLKFYDDEIWKVDFYNNPIIFKYVLKSSSNLLSEVKIFDRKIFSPYIPGNKYNCIVEDNDSVTIHWYSKNWNMSRKGYVFLNTKHISNPIRRVFSMIKKNIAYAIKVKNM